ncbi:thiamine-phosphate kinase [Glutamicibacter sp. MNS18]|uniref:thiamine-phosphate kinase n=1 Tax=Glutamicibacter sp. MNS18 TaxID=2989817 RepID=UPI0022359556|nr:thiamine-phosphate kinase [Glutamicibacter sp. MNS18]MCW4466183.1 thiamine-phosphate kinase [Glutamicibacter sp. MNS18]
MAHSVKTSEQTVSELGESGILQVILPILRSENPLLGPGDDAGALKVASGEVLVSVDTMVQDQDFKQQWPSGLTHRAFDIGWKSVAQNLSDINAMGGRTTGVVISLSLPGQTAIAWVEDFAHGVARALKELPTTPPAILGGDLGLSTEISVTTTALGESAGRKMLRSGAQTGDVIAVAGRVGVAAAGLALLEHPDSSHLWGRALRRLVQGQCRPVPPLESGPRAEEAGATAMLDLSDGLIVDGGRLAASSAVSLKIDSTALTEFAERLEPAAHLLHTEPLQWVLYGGEDFGLLATFPNEQAVPEEFTIIGTVGAADSTGPAVYIDGEKMAESKGFDHFS